MLCASLPPRQAQTDYKKTHDYVVPSRCRVGTSQQPGGSDQPETEQQVYEAQRPRNFGHGADGADGNSPYTKALAATMQTPGLDIFQKIGRAHV